MRKFTFKRRLLHITSAGLLLICMFAFQNVASAQSSSASTIFNQQRGTTSAPAEEVIAYAKDKFTKIETGSLNFNETETSIRLEYYLKMEEVAQNTRESNLAINQALYYAKKRGVDFQGGRTFDFEALHNETINDLQ